MSQPAMTSTPVQGPMKTHRFGVENFFVFETRQDGDTWMVHFIWGKKDFRIYLRPADVAGSGAVPMAEVQGADGRALHVTALQYLNQFEWYEYDGLSGHGLHHDEVRWKRGKQKRYVELPKDFFDISVRIACGELGLERKAS
jgi:hypothetical protein